MSNVRSNRWYSYLGHRVRELGIYGRNLQIHQRSPKIVFCVDNDYNGFSSGLRGYEISNALTDLGWGSIVIPKQLEIEGRKRIIQRVKPDVLLLQSARHPLNRPHLYPDQFCVFDLDDADFLDPKLIDIIIGCARNSKASIAGSFYVANYLKEYCKNVEVIWTGSRPFNKNEISKSKPPIVAWACSNPFRYPEEGKLVQDILLNISQKINYQFWLMGTQDSQEKDKFFQPLKSSGIFCQSIPFLPYKKLLETLKQVTIGLAPLLPEKSSFSAGKSFGKVLAYLNTEVAVIASNCVDHPLFFQDGVNGFLASDVSEWTQKLEWLLMNPIECEKIGKKGKKDYLQRLTTTVSGQKTDLALRHWLKEVTE